MVMRKAGIIFILSLVVSFVDAQDRISSPSVKTTVLTKMEMKRQQEANELFHRIEEGIVHGTPDTYSDTFAPSISLSIGTLERGVYSANQTKAILSEYFSVRRITAFTFSRIKSSTVNPYATGRMMYIQKGNQESAQVYVLLSWQNTHWKISQFNIY